MKYCIHCGKEIDDDANFCPFCGQSCDNQINYEYNIQQEVVSDKKSGLKLAAFILALLTTIGTCWVLIPLLWTIPMTVKIYKSYKYNQPLSMGFKVCSILFLNTIAGILLLIDDR